MIIKDMPNFGSLDEKIAWLHKNQEELIMEAKSTIKYADAVMYADVSDYNQNDTNKAFSMATRDTDTELKRSLVINTSNIYDSHEDVHIPGWGTKSIKENKSIKFLQEHQMKFDAVIAHKEDLRVSFKQISWKDLGYDFEGETDALVFDANIKANKNNFMFNQYKNDDVDNHSVGMQYQKVVFAVNSEDPEYAKNKEHWDKYYPMVANQKDIKNRYFWAVLEAKVIEGSAVVVGSNRFTPTMSRVKHSEPEVIESKQAADALAKGIINFLKN